MRSRFSVLTLIGIAIAGGCRNEPGSMTKGEVEDKLKEELKLKSVTLEPAQKGFEGTGNRNDGSTIKLSVVQKKEDRSLSYSATNEKGGMSAGTFKVYSPTGTLGDYLRAWHQLKLWLLLLLPTSLIVYIVWKGRISTATAREPVDDKQ